MSPERHAAPHRANNGQGWTSRVWASAEMFGQPVPLKVTRVRLDAGAWAQDIPIGCTEAFGYVIAGSGAAGPAPAGEGGHRFALDTESVLWLADSDSLSVAAGPDGLDLLVARNTEPVAEGGFPPLYKSISASNLPHLVSTRDTRDRLDLVTENVPVGARTIRADRIIYHPGDTAAAHYHTDCHHVFCVLAGSGLLYTDGAATRLAAGDSALVGPGEVHWFENDRQEEFSFVEFWAPPPAETIWTVTGDRCTWAPAG
jgi:quercetin dioxygenase-like cupin family protein